MTVTKIYMRTTVWTILFSGALKVSASILTLKKSKSEKRTLPSKNRNRGIFKIFKRLTVNTPISVPPNLSRYDLAVSIISLLSASPPRDRTRYLVPLEDEGYYQILSQLLFLLFEYIQYRHQIHSLLIQSACALHPLYALI